jgi:hypothetical protein
VGQWIGAREWLGDMRRSRVSRGEAHARGNAMEDWGKTVVATTKWVPWARTVVDPSGSGRVGGPGLIGIRNKKSDFVLTFSKDTERRLNQKK